MNNNRHTAMMERKQEVLRQKLESGPLSVRFPEVLHIIMHMTYNQKGTRPILRTFHFTPQSYAFFVVNCLRQGCTDGGFDLTEVVDSMVRTRKKDIKGALHCKGTDSSNSHSDIVYEIDIKYT